MSETIRSIRTNHLTRRRLGGTFSEYPDDFGDSAYALLNTILFTLAFTTLTVLVVQLLRNEGIPRQISDINNRHLVITCILLGSMERMFYIPAVDRFYDTPQDLRYVFRMLKDMLWFTAFALLVAFWMEIQVSTTPNTVTVTKFRGRLIGVVMIFAFLRVGQMALEITNNKLRNWAKGVVALYMFVLFFIAAYWAVRLRRRLTSMAEERGRKSKRASSAAQASSVKDALLKTVQRLTIFMILEAFFIFTLTITAGVDWYLEDVGVINPMSTPNTCLTMKVIKRFTEFMLIAVLWKMLDVKRIGSGMKDTPDRSVDMKEFSQRQNDATHVKVGKSSYYGKSGIDANAPPENDRPRELHSIDAGSNGAHIRQLSHYSPTSLPITENFRGKSGV